jgi:large subunit ribosomal protein L21
VGAKVLKHLKGDKVIVFKKKRRKGYRVKNGHRQSLTEIQIDSIVTSGAKKAAPAKTAKKAAAKSSAPATQEAKVEAPKAEAPAQDLTKMTVAQLKELAKAKGITGISAMKKADLIAALS